MKPSLKYVDQSHKTTSCTTMPKFFSRFAKNRSNENNSAYKIVGSEQKYIIAFMSLEKEFLKNNFIRINDAI